MKYTLTNISKTINGKTLYKIKAIADFGNVVAGDTGGWVESYNNLSQEDNCWIYSNAMVYDDACVFGNARVYSRANVYGKALVYGHAKVSGSSCVYDSAQIFGQCKVSDNARVYETAQVYGNSLVRGNCRVYGSAQISEKQVCKYGHVTTNLSKNIIANIEAQTSLAIFNGEVYCYKYITEEQLTIFETGKYVEHTGIDVYNAQLKNDGDYSKYRLFCKVNLDDIITIQDEKIICTKLFVLGICDDIFSLV